MQKLASALCKSIAALMLICLVSIGIVSAAQEPQSSAPAPVAPATPPSLQPGSVTLSPAEVKDQTKINTECEGLADELVLTRKERDVEREGRLEAIDAAKLYRSAAEDYKAAAEKQAIRGDRYQAAYEAEVRRGKIRTVKVGGVLAAIAFGLGLLLGH